VGDGKAASVASSDTGGWRTASEKEDFMRLCLFETNKLGVVEGDKVADVSHVLNGVDQGGWPRTLGDPLIERLDDIRPIIEAALTTAERRPLAGSNARNPVVTPAKVIGAPVNYLDHLAEAKADRQTFFDHQLVRIHEIGLFLKASTSLISHIESVALRHEDRRTDHELELAIVIGKRADRVKHETAMNHVAGYMIGLDMTVRGKEERSMRKSIDSYSVLGPWLVTADEISDPGNLDMKLKVNGETRQMANTCDLVIDVPGLIEFASSYYTLFPGDVIMTGTPAGVGPVLPGDVMSAWIEGVGSMDIGVTAL
jgi:2,4-didehydro-3-deoxy-L-rhamnonate hydrolase